MAVGRRDVLVATVVASLGLASAAEAKTFVVTKLGDPSPQRCKPSDCSLREAVIAANKRSGPDKVELPASRAYRLARENTNPAGEDRAARGDLDVTGALRIVHPGRGLARVDARRIDRVFDVFAGTSFSHLVIKKGLVRGDGFGGGIRASADVRVIRSVVIGNRTEEDDGGGIAFPDEDGSLTVSRSAVSRNFSGDDGGGVSFDESGPGFFRVFRSRFTANRSADWGGGFITAKTANIVKSTFANNTSMDGAGGGGAIEIPEGSVIRDSTFSGNEADAGGGLTINDGSDSSLRNVTIANNSADNEGGGLRVAGGEASLNAVTIARNSAELAGGLFGDPAGAVSVENSILALNSAVSSGDDCFGFEPFDSLGFNLLSTAGDCAGFDAEGDVVDPAPGIGSLSRNGGPTRTVPLLAGSPAIGAANPLTAPAKDQRGEDRDASPDAGAFEGSG